MLEILVRHDAQQNPLLQMTFPDDIDTEAVANMIRAAIEAHKTSLERPSSGQPERVLRLGKPAKGHSEKGIVTVTPNVQAVLAAMLALGRPLIKAQELLPILEKDHRYRGKSMETVRYLLRQFELAGLIGRTPENKRELSLRGRELAEKFSVPMSTDELNTFLDEVFDGLGDSPNSP